MKYIPKIAAWLGALLLLGTAGASDAGSIGMGQTILQLIIGLVLLSGGILAQEVARRGDNHQNQGGDN